jgi:hypothetical protein
MFFGKRKKEYGRREGKAMNTTKAIIFFLCFWMIQSTAAAKLEDEHTPISFKVEMLPWKQVNEVLPNKSKFTVIDVETGLHFRVQRRAGNRHADVQPLTREDTKIMKKIYNGKWSWKRRAIIVLSHDQMIAASMHGMPHGAGALINGFPGHFCIHFAGSTTHRSGRADVSHEMMILKAAGKLEEYLQYADPYQVVNTFTVAVNQQDASMLDMVITNPSKAKKLHRAVSRIESIRFANLPSRSQKNTSELLCMEFALKADLYLREEGKSKKTVRFIMRRDHVADRWRIDSTALLESFIK